MREPDDDDGGGDGGDGDKGDEGGDDEDERPVAKPAPRPVAAAPGAPAARPTGQRFVLEAGNRKVETFVSIDGKTVRMDSIETYASPDAAKKAHERLKKMLAGEGYKE